MILTKDQILERRPLPVEEVEVSEWGGTVRIQGLTAAQRDDFEASIVQHKGQRVELNRQYLRAKLLARCIVGADDKALLTEADVIGLAAQSAAVIERLFTVAQRLSGLGPEDVETLAKN